MSDMQCTGFPDQALGVSWQHCCIAHDLAYSAGAPRGEADAELYQCILQATGLDWLATMMLAGVTLFGWIFYNRHRNKGL